MKKVLATFEFTTAGGNAAKEKENWQPNLVRGGGRSLSDSWRRVEEEGSMESSSNITSGCRKRISVAPNKRKAKEVVLGESMVPGKKPSLQLRDEDHVLTAATAEQSRRAL